MNSRANSGDPFRGVWKLCPEDSHLGKRSPQSWIQNIEVAGDKISVQEEIVFAGGALKTALAAKFDGKDYFVQGSPLADTIAYTRKDERHISGIARKNGAVTLTETAAISEDGNTLTLTYSLHATDPEVSASVAVFRRQDDLTWVIRHT